MLFADETIRRLVTDACLSVCAVAVGMAAPAVAQLPCSYEISHVIQAPETPPFGHPPTAATAISPDGRYVCGSFMLIGSGFTRAFVYDTQSREFQVLPLPPGGYQSSCNDVNDAGLAVGSYWVSGGVAPQRGFVYSISAGQYIAELMPYPGASWCAVTAINSSNEVCGFRSIGSKGDTVNPQTAFRWSAAKGFDNLGLIEGHSTFAEDIADDGAVAVNVALGTPPHIWHGDRLLNVGGLKGADGSGLAAIRARDHAVGGSQFIVQDKGFWTTAFEFRDGVLNVLPPLDALNTTCTPMAIAKGGLIFGGCKPNGGQGNWQPCAWTSEGAVALSELFVSAPEMSVNLARDASLAGRVICSASVNGDVVSIVLEPQLGVIGDTNCDAQVNVDDLILVIIDWGETHSPADANHDQIVDVVDLSIVIEHWTLN
jgi:hypothetical protein